MIVHILDQINTQPLEKGDGAIGIIVAPTRELCKQIYTETKKFSKLHKLKYVFHFSYLGLSQPFSHHIRVASLFGGLKGKKEQILKLREGVHIVVATPGR